MPGAAADQPNNVSWLPQTQCLLPSMGMGEQHLQLAQGHADPALSVGHCSCVGNTCVRVYGKDQCIRVMLEFMHPVPA